MPSPTSEGGSKGPIPLGRTAAFLLLLLSAGACDLMGPGEEGGPGYLEITLGSPHGAEGAAVVRLQGGKDLGPVYSIGGETLYQHFEDSSKVVVVLDDPGEISFRVRTENVRRLPEVTVVQVADGENQLRASTSGYSVEVARERDGSTGGGES